MKLSKIYNEYSEELVFGLVFGLFSGLFSGLVFGLFSGLVYGLVSGLVYGLVFGLFSGLFSGLVFGLVSGLVSGLVYGLVSGLVSGLVFGLVIIIINIKEVLPFELFYSIILMIGLIILISEILFYFTKKEKERNPKRFLSIKISTIKYKLECLFESLLILSGITQIYVLIREGSKYLTKELLNEVIKWIGYIGIGLIIILLILGLVWLWFKLNDLDLKENKKIK